MVGRIIYKDFETGSYEKMLVTVFDGISYPDMEKNNDFSSYLVTFSEKKIQKQYVSSDSAPRCTINEILAVCRKAREFLFCHNYVTVAEFVLAGENIRIRSVSSKSGAYSPVDFSAVFTKGMRDVYKLVAEFKDTTHLYRSLLCSVLNYCVSEIFGIEEEMFGVSSAGVYANVSLFKFSKEALGEAKVPCELCALMKTVRKRRHMINPARIRHNFPHMEESQRVLPRERLISDFRFLRYKVLKTVLGLMPRPMNAPQITRFILSLPCKEEIICGFEEYYDLLHEFVLRFEHVFEAKSHVDYLEVEDVFSLACREDTAVEAAKRASALSANMKLRCKLPCPPYYDSSGRAYWEKG